VKDKLKTVLYLALLAAGIVAFAEWQKSNDEAFKKNDPKGYERALEYERMEGKPDPRG